MTINTPRTGWPEIRRRLIILSVLGILLLANQFSGRYISDGFEWIANVVLLIALSLTIMYFAFRSSTPALQKADRKAAIDEITQRVMDWSRRRKSKREDRK